MRAIAIAAFGILGILAISCSEQPAPEINSTAKTSSTADKVGQSQKTSAKETAAPPPKLLPREEIRAGWVQLFDGESLFGWKSNSGTNWQAADGVIRAAAEEPPGLLHTTVPWADFELKCDFRVEDGGNSGLFLRSRKEPQEPAVDCYELNICDTHESFPTGSLVGRKKVPLDAATDGEWNTFHVRADGNQIKVTLNGKEVLDFEDTSANQRAAGLIGLQKNEGRVEFRNITLRPLGAEPIFNGQDLTGWREVPGSQSNFEVVDGMLHVTDGRGYLETEPTWADFIFQAEVRTNGKHLNSGIFFRAMPGTEENPAGGYEYQIHNGYEDGDPTQPSDYGTGGIFRRVKARRVVADDEQWFTATLVAHGPHFATWVDGYPVATWTDDRKPHENPRQGRRLKAGHISLQGHDPTTDLDFRNLRIADYPQTEEK